jgi:hypothetical protein
MAKAKSTVGGPRREASARSDTTLGSSEEGWKQIFAVVGAAWIACPPATVADRQAWGLIWAGLKHFGAPLRIKQRAGHSTFSTTEGYIREAENLSAAFGDVFPRLPVALYQEPTKSPLRVQVSRMIVEAPGIEAENSRAPTSPKRSRNRLENKPLRRQRRTQVRSTLGPIRCRRYRNATPRSPTSNDER